MAENKNKKVLNVPNKRELTPNTFDTAEHKEVRLKRNVPNLRFKEFEGEWKECRLGEIMNFSEKRINASTLTTSNYISTENMLQDFQGVIEAKSVPNNTNVISFTYGDILISNIRPYLKKVWKASIDGGCSSDVLVMKANDKINNDYLHYVIANNRFINFVMNGSKGVKMPRGDKEQMKTYIISLPPMVKEQNKIATFLSLLDERIATQNKIIDKLESLIKGLNQRLLCNNKWKTYKIKDIADIGRGRVISSIEIEQQHQPKYPVYSSQTSNNGIMGYLDDYMFDGEYITWTTDGANAGTVFYRNGKFNCTNVCGTLKINQEHNCYFVSLVLQQSTHYYVSTNLANPKLMNNTMASIKIKLPNIEEQNYLSKIFFLLNEHLYTNIRINKFYLEQKQYLLRHMFI